MRYFISIDVDETPVKERIVTFMNSISGYGDMNTVSPENLHITVLYLGDDDSIDRETARTKFIDACEFIDEEEFTCECNSVGAFPHMNYISTVWIGVEPEDKLNELHMTFSEEMNIESEHDYVPHITVGRLSSIDPGDKERLQREIQADREGFGTFSVENVRLKESVSTEDGPQYRDLEVHAL